MKYQLFSKQGHYIYHNFREDPRKIDHPMLQMVARKQETMEALKDWIAQEAEYQIQASEIKCGFPRLRSEDWWLWTKRMERN